MTTRFLMILSCLACGPSVVVPPTNLAEHTTCQSETHMCLVNDPMELSCTGDRAACYAVALRRCPEGFSIINPATNQESPTAKWGIYGWPKDDPHQQYSLIVRCGP